MVMDFNHCLHPWTFFNIFLLWERAKDLQFEYSLTVFVGFPDSDPEPPVTRTDTRQLPPSESKHFLNISTQFGEICFSLQWTIMFVPVTELQYNVLSLNVSFSPEISLNQGACFNEMHSHI